MIVYAVVVDALLPGFPLGVALEVFIRREDAERFVEEVRGDETEIAEKLRIEEREREAGGLKPTLIQASALMSASCERRSVPPETAPPRRSP